MSLCKHLFVMIMFTFGEHLCCVVLESGPRKKKQKKNHKMGAGSWFLLMGAGGWFLLRGSVIFHHWCWLLSGIGHDSR